MISADNYPMSEAGHLHSGASRKNFSDRLKINRSIADITSSKNAPFLNVMQKPKKTGGALHLIGIASFFSKKAKRRKVNQT